jgi:hypothetical protein
MKKLVFILPILLFLLWWCSENSLNVTVNWLPYQVNRLDLTWQAQEQNITIKSNFPATIKIGTWEYNIDNEYKYNIKFEEWKSLSLLNFEVYKWDKSIKSQMMVYRNLSEKEIIDNNKKDEEYKKWVEESNKLNSELDNELLAKYKKIIGNKYQYEIEKEIHDLWFIMDKSWLSKSPDGSTQPYAVFKKKEWNKNIYICLQWSYSLWEHYQTVSIDSSCM